MKVVKQSSYHALYVCIFLLHVTPFAKADLPIHCLRKDVIGIWKIYVISKEPFKTNFSGNPIFSNFSSLVLATAKCFN